MVVVIYFGGRATLWANFDDYCIGGREYMHQFHGHFFSAHESICTAPVSSKIFCLALCNMSRRAVSTFFYHLYYSKILFCISTIVNNMKGSSS